jgi:large subunit ribosomal protein L31
MKSGIHPTYYRTKVTCACGATYEVGSTKQSMRVDVCARCHPFYTGKQRIVDTGGRVERFRRRAEKAVPKG